MEKKKYFWTKHKKKPYKKNQFKTQLVQNGLKGDQNWPSGPIGPSGMNYTEVDLIGLNWTKIDLIEPNGNCLIFTENKLY